MNGKQVIGLLILLAGIGLIFYGFYSRGEIQAARGDIDRQTRIIPDNPVKDIFKGELESKVNRHQGPVKLLFIGGGILVVAGCAILIFARTRKK